MKLLLALLTALLVLLALPTTTLIFRPEWIPFDWLIERFATPFLNSRGLSWETFHLEVRSLTVRRKEIQLLLKNPCYFHELPGSPEGWVHACFDSARIHFTAHFSWNSIRKARALERISLLELDHGKVLAAQPGSRERAGLLPQDSPPVQPPGLLRWLENTKLGSARIEVDEWRIQGRDPRRLPSSEGHFFLRTLSGSAGRPRELLHAQFRWEFSAKTPMGPALRAEGTFLQNPEGSPRPFRGTFQALATDLVPWTGKLLDGNIPIHQVRAPDCAFQLDPAASVQLACDLGIRTKYLHPAEKESVAGILFRVLRAPEFRELRAHLEGEWNWGTRPTEGFGRLELDPFMAGPARVLGSVEADFRPNQRVPLHFEARAAFVDFQKAVHSLENTHWAVPAPLNDLAGKLLLEGQGSSDLQSFVALDLGLSTDLRTRKLRRSALGQRLKLESEGRLLVPLGEPPLPPELTVRTTLMDVQLALPTLKFGMVPPVLPDSRFVSFSEEISKKKMKKTLPMQYQLSFRNAPERPAFLVSNLAKSRVPVWLDLTLSGEGISGFVQAGEFPLELFRRDAKVETVRVGFKPARGRLTEHPLHSVVEVRYVDYIVRIEISGSIEKPILNLSSEPPLPQDQLIAVLLFGQPMDSLAPDQTTSVGEARAALAGGAIDFLSLYLLASTPIQSIGYDPRTGVFTAKVRLAEGTSLNVGADPSELQTIELQKRLGPHWTITTQLADPTTAERRTLQAFLEWSRRY